ncbi:hypothetical protein B6D52_03255 [Candidatus Parcubacteria bacterium 4484_255]|nr:MAG: hypothetical protein B6D52_03255 [Candidatus Parcubacteria bacterium 4484_255]
MNMEKNIPKDDAEKKLTKKRRAHRIKNRGKPESKKEESVIFKEKERIKIKVGDLVQWRSRDIDQFADGPKKIIKIETYKGREYALFEDIKTGVPVDELYKVDEEKERKKTFHKKPEEMSEEDKAKKTEAREKAMEDKEMLYKAKIDLREDISGEEKVKLKEKVKFVNKENIKETYEKEIKSLITLSYDKEDKAKNEEYKTKIDALSEQMGLPQEEIQKIIDTQKVNFEELVYQREKKKKSKKESKWKKIRRLLPKIAIYGGAIGLGILTGGAFAVAIGAGMGAFRITETIFKGKKSRKAQDAAILESKKMLLGEIDETDMSEAEKKEKDACLKTFYDNIFIGLSLAKQNQIENKEKEFSELGKKIAEAEGEYKPKDKKSKEKLQKLYAERREAHKAQIKKYLEAQGLEGEELDKRIKLSAQLVELEDNQNIMELDFAKRKAGKVSKIFNKLDKILSHPAFLGGSRRGGSQTKEKLITASIFAVAGILARACPIVRNILMAYAGMKLGSAAANLFVSRENKELLKQVSAESINLNSSPDDISKAKAQLLDSKFKEANPIEYAKLQEKIFAIDRAKMEALLGKSEGDEDGGYIGETNRRLEETIKKRRVAKGAHKGMKIFLGAAGAAAGWFIGEYLSNKSEIKAQQQARQQELAETQKEFEEKVRQAQVQENNDLIAEAQKKAEEELRAEQAKLAELEALNKPIIVEKGDTVWGKLNDQLSRRVGPDNWNKLPQEQRDYIIDLYKDKVVANPSLIGIEGNNASALKIGDELNFAKLFEDSNEMNQAIEKASGLSQEAIDNIAANRELIGNVMSGKLENASGTDLIKAMNIMGGGEQSGAGFVQEFQNRTTDIIGANASPEQMQTILHNPKVFGPVMDQGLDKIEDENLIEATRLLNGTKAIGQDFVKEVAKMDSPLGREVSSRIEDLQTKITDRFGDIHHSQMHPDVGLSFVDTDPLSIQTEQALNNSESLIEQGQKIQELIGKSDSWWHKFWGINGKIDRLRESFNEAVKDYDSFIRKYNALIREGQSYGQRWFELTGDKGLLQNYFQGDYLRNNGIKIKENIKDLAKIIKAIREHFAPSETYRGAV